MASGEFYTNDCAIAITKPRIRVFLTRFLTKKGKLLFAQIQILFVLKGGDRLKFLV